jgi:hypothetical protein
MAAPIALCRLCERQDKTVFANSNNKAYITSDTGIDGDNNPDLSPHFKSPLLSLSKTYDRNGASKGEQRGFRGFPDGCLQRFRRSSPTQNV